MSLQVGCYPGPAFPGPAAVVHFPGKIFGNEAKPFIQSFIYYKITIANQWKIEIYLN